MKYKLIPRPFTAFGSTCAGCVKYLRPACPGESQCDTDIEQVLASRGVDPIFVIDYVWAEDRAHSTLED